MHNSQELIGILGQDPEAKFTQGGMCICTFSLATKHSKKVGDKWEPVTTWHNVVVFGKRGEWLSNNIAKGSKMHIQGRTEHQSWDKKDGSGKGYKTVVVANQSNLLSEVKSPDTPLPDKPSTPPTGSSDDLPF